MDYVAALRAVIGDLAGEQAPPGGWERLAEVAGTDVPPDLRQIVEYCAPVQLNGHLILWHPNTELFNMSEKVAQYVDILRGVDWESHGALFRGAHPEFGGRDGLILVAMTDRREYVFVARAAEGDGWSVVGLSGDGDTFYEYDWSFAEWLYRYCAGEELIGPDSEANYPGPLLVELLPRRRGEHVVTLRGPRR
ncbi:hypothetical protein GCM10009665_39620 [Kitasatospora nipponensis]|uniref:SMI1/KNR4 family protein n=1 Tax=Kitasatospora nipponensis TaxID=258049 RepID=A0ABN1WIC9_9ACTN